MSQKTLLFLFALASLCTVIVVTIVLYLPPAPTPQVDNQSREVKGFEAFYDRQQKLPALAEEVSLLAVGDVMLSRTVADRIRKYKDINYPFLKLQAFLQNADITFGNLENPITAGQPVMPFEMVLRANPGQEEALQKAGFDIFSLANNHIPDLGEKGVLDTLHYLKKAGLDYVGAGKNSTEANAPVYITKQGITIAFLAYNDTDVVPDYYEAGEQHAGTAFMKQEKMTEAIREAKTKADLVVVSMHAGKEYVGQPNASQISFAHQAIEAGAEIVIGHHPHVVQTIEKYQGKYIIYSLGNFVFDQMWSSETKEGVTVKIVFDKAGVKSIFFYPIGIEDYSQPELLKGEQAAAVLKRLHYPLSEAPSFQWNADTKNYETQTSSFISERGREKGNRTKVIEQDINKNGSEEIISLKEGKVTITEQSELLWESPSEWWIDDVAVSDINQDGMVEINFSVWKAGNFGSSKPSWVVENDMSVRNHFFVFNLVGKDMKPLWQSSNLERPNCKFLITDVDNDQKNDLVTLEGDYNDSGDCVGKFVAVWKWNGWGFSNQWRSQPSIFQDIMIEKFGTTSRIVVF